MAHVRLDRNGLDVVGAFQRGNKLGSWLGRRIGRVA